MMHGYIQTTIQLLLAFCAISLAWLITRHHASKKLDRREPHVVPSTIPYIGHIIGMIISGGRYTKHIACEYSPIFTLPMLGSRMYIVTDPALAAIVQKTKSLSFNPIIPQVTKRILGLDPSTVRILSTNIGREDGPDGFYPEVRDLVYSTLTPGDRLDELTDHAATVFRKHLTKYADTLTAQGSGSSIEDLLLWTQHIVTVVTAEFLYGPSNPIATDPSLEGAFWDFDHGLGQLLAFASLVPSITARKAYKGREAVVAALKDYFISGQYMSGSYLIRKRVEIAKKYSMSWDGIARSELSFLFAGIVNTAVTSFWVILRILADRDLFDAIEREIAQAHQSTSNSSSTPADLSPTILAASCPLFLSTYRETLRLGSDNSSNRLVTTDDTILADRYLLARNAIVQISGAAMHANRDIWGDDAATFDAHRFMPENLKERQVHPAAFRAFGGGTTLCPGRHFASREILFFVALVLRMFDLEGIDDQGKNEIKGANVLKVPRKKDNVLPVHILEPDRATMVRFKVRQ